MPVLATLIYPQGGEFSPQRQYLTGWAIGWQPDAIATVSGNPTVLHEFSFGGYDVVIELKDWVYVWDNRSFTLGEMFENLYATPPGGGAPVSCGNVIVQWRWEATFNTPFLEISVDAVAPHYYFQRLPPQTRPYWNTPPDHFPPTPFFYPP